MKCLFEEFVDFISILSPQNTQFLIWFHTRRKYFVQF